MAGLAAGVGRSHSIWHITGEGRSHSGLVEFQEAPMGTLALEMCSMVACSSKLLQKDGTPGAKWTTCMSR